jgi:hypothetical protein
MQFTDEDTARVVAEIVLSPPGYIDDATPIGDIKTMVRHTLHYAAAQSRLEVPGVLDPEAGKPGSPFQASEPCWAYGGHWKDGDVTAHKVCLRPRGHIYGHVYEVHPNPSESDYHFQDATS